MLVGLSGDDLVRVGIELHHYPLTLYDICEIVLERYEQENLRITVLAIANEVVALHYQNIIGLVPLSTTMHEAAHDGQLYIHPKNIFGNWLDFLNIYKKYLLNHIKEKLTIISSKWDNENIEEVNSSVLNIEPCFIEANLITLEKLLEYKPEEEGIPLDDAELSNVLDG
jgi:hypothetical protein